MPAIFPGTSMPDRDWWSALWPDPVAVLRQIGIRQDMTVLDLCCGDGYFTAPLALLVDGCVYALDVDPHMINKAKAEVARAGVSVRRWICADASRAADLVSETVDYVLMANTFHGVAHQTALANTVHAALRPNGLFAIVNWHSLPREETTVLGQPRGPRTEARMSHDAVAAAVEPAGFRLDRVIELPPYHYAALFEAMPRQPSCH